MAGVERVVIVLQGRLGENTPHWLFAWARMSRGIHAANPGHHPSRPPSPFAGAALQLVEAADGFERGQLVNRQHLQLFEQRVRLGGEERQL